MNVGKRLKEARLAKGITLEELAREIGATAVTLSRIENGLRDVGKFELIRGLCKALGVSADDLLDLDKKAEANEMIELLPCPFCGEDAVLQPNGRVFHKGKANRAAYVFCPSCGATAKKVWHLDYGCTSHSAEAEQEAARLWNMRAESEENS